MNHYMLVGVSLLLFISIAGVAIAHTQIYEYGAYQTTLGGVNGEWLQWNSTDPTKVRFVGDAVYDYSGGNCWTELRIYTKYAPPQYAWTDGPHYTDYSCGTSPTSTIDAVAPTSGYYYNGNIFFGTVSRYFGTCVACSPLVISEQYTFIFFDGTTNTISGNFTCVDNTTLYIKVDAVNYTEIGYDTSSPYSFTIYDNTDYRMIFSDGAYYDFSSTGSDITFDYDACIWVYGYTCGVDTIKLYKDDGGWVLDDSVGQGTGYDVYEIPIVDGEDYKISFLDGATVCHNQTFSCSGDHVLIDFDRCQWVYPPSPYAPPYTIYLWTGYDYNIVVFRDEHGNFIENSQLAIYDKTDDQYIQRWTEASEGYTLLGAKFAADHDVQLSLRTFDGIFTIDTTFPANGSAAVGEEDITTTNWTVPIKYNLNVLPVDQYGAALFDVFCGLSEYTPLDPGAFWGMDLSDQGYVAVTNCSGFAMCDIIAEKEGYADYRVEALNWTSKSALVKDYRHNVVMEEE